MSPPVVTIAYLGSSVTAQSHGFRPLLHLTLCRELGRAYRPVNAAVGGVGSISGLFLLDELVLRHRPRLCFIEFASTDMVGKTPPELLPGVLEALVQRLRSADCEPCFVLLDRADPQPRRAATLAAYRDAAAALDVTCVDLAERIAAEPAMLSDHVHTNDRGAAMIATEVAAAVRDIVEREPLPAADPPPLASAEIVRARASELRGAGRIGDLGGVFEYVAARPGDRFTAAPDGIVHGLVVAVGPASGAVEIASGERREYHLLWDEWCWYDRLSTVISERPWPAGAQLTIDPVEAEIDYSRCLRPVDPATGMQQDLRLIAYMVQR